AQTPEPKPANPSGFFYDLTSKYLPRAVPRVDYTNSPRLEQLMRAGRIYLSLEDAIALALENNLDIEFARYGPRLSEANLLRANAGQLLRNVGGGTRGGPSSASLGVLGGANSLGSGDTGGGGSGSGGVLSGLNVQLAGTSIPNLDPSAFWNGQFTHQTSPQT